jgi:hypothetical protein
MTWRQNKLDRSFLSFILQPSLIFDIRQEPTWVKHLSCAAFKSKLFAIPANIIQSWICLAGTNALAYFAQTKKKVFIELTQIDIIHEMSASRSTEPTWKFNYNFSNFLLIFFQNLKWSLFFFFLSRHPSFLEWLGSVFTTLNFLRNLRIA